ncbi:hypothetical protein M758_1G183500 [Ceratodon purpureus]|nr:hypothetical protein M758_1G183500 [Ceratodon purpureus]
MEVLRSCSALGAIGCASAQSVCSASRVHCGSVRAFASVVSDDLRSSAFIGEGVSLGVGKSWKQAKCSGRHFDVSALLRDNAKSGDDNGAPQLKISGDNGAPKSSGNAKSGDDDSASQSKISGSIKPSENVKSQNGNGSSQSNEQSKRSSENGAFKPSDSDAQTTSSDQMDCNGANSNRSGLFRTPISGGVQSATSSHNLPAPAVAVRNLIEQAQFAHLCTVMSRMHHRRQGYPFGSFVDFAPDDSGHLIFSFSALAIHTRNLLSDPRCTVVIQLPGSGGLGNARVTIFGDVYPLSPDQQELAHKFYGKKHQHSPSHQWGNFTYYRMHNISDIYFVGGFGTVAWVDVKEYEKAKPDIIAVNGSENILKELNATYSIPLREVLNTEVEVDDVALISIDSKGADIRVRQGVQFNVQRVSFDEVHAVETLEQAKKALQKVLDRAYACLAYAD